MAKKKADCGKTKAGKPRKTTKAGTCRKRRPANTRPIGPCLTWDKRNGYRWTVGGPCSSRALKSKRYLNQNKTASGGFAAGVGIFGPSKGVGDGSWDKFFAPAKPAEVKPVAVAPPPVASTLDLFDEWERVHNQ